jgi:hypothetical protein
MSTQGTVFSRFSHRSTTLRRAGVVSVVGVLVASLTLAIALPASAAPAACVAHEVTVPIKVQLDGAYSSTLGHMTNTLNTLGYLPTLEPYAALGYVMRGGESNTAVLTDTTSSNAPVDWILVELRSALDPTQIVATDTVMLGEDGLPVTAPSFAVKADNYYVAIEHRNHLGLMTAAPVAVTAATALVDFSNPALAMYNNAPGVDGNRRTANGVTQMLGGETNHIVGSAANRLDFGSDPTTDKSALLARLGGNTGAVVQGYYLEDVTMDGKVRFTGVNNDSTFILSRLGGDQGAVLPEQLPIGVLGASVICGSPVFTSPTTATFTATYASSFALSAAGDSPITFTLAGTLPAGLSFDSTAGIISGTTTAVGTYPVTITATNPVGSQQQTLAVTVLTAVGTLINAQQTVNNNQARATNITYTEQFTPSRTGVIAAISFGGAVADSAIIGLGSVFGIGTGTAATVPGVGLVYTLTTPVSVAAGTPVYIEFTGVTNPQAQTTAWLATTLNTSGAALETATILTTFGNANTAAVIQVAKSLTFTNDTPSYTLLMDPSLAALADKTKSITLTVKTNAGQGYAVTVADSGLVTAGTGSTLYSIPGSALGGVSSAAFASNTFGFSASLATPLNSVATLAPAGLAAAGNFIGFSTLGSTLVSATKPTGNTPDRVVTTNRVKIDYSTPAGTYTDTITYTATPAY